MAMHLKQGNKGKSSHTIHALDKSPVTGALLKRIRMKKEEELEFRVIMSPMFLVATAFVLMLIFTWGNWLFFGDSSYVSAYYKLTYQSPFDAIMGGSFIDMLSASILVFIYIYSLWIYVKPILNRWH